MTEENVDHEFEILVTNSQSLEHEFSNRLVDEQWSGSPFKWIKSHEAGTKGLIGVRLLSCLCAVHDISFSYSEGNQSDKRVGGKLAEIKFATLSRKGSYIFNQIRNQEYEVLICLGVSPNSAHCWVVPKKVALQNASGQHGGRSATETFQIQVNPSRVKQWLIPYGGSLDKAIPLLTMLENESRRKRVF